MTLKTIQRGTTLSKMVAAHNKAFGTNLTVEQVAKANGLKDANKIVAGKQMLFPDKFEKNAPQRVFQNGDDKPVVRNGVNESVTVNAEPELITTQNTPVSTRVTPRPLEKLPAKSDVTQKQPELISTQNTPVSTRITPRPLEKLPAKPDVTQKQPELISTRNTPISTSVTPRPLEKLPTKPEAMQNQPALISTQNTPVSTSVTPRPTEKLPAKPDVTQKPRELISTQNPPVSTSITPRPTEKPPALISSTDSKVSSTSTSRAPETKTALSLTEFLAANKDQKLSVDSLRKKGMSAAASDLNGDGVVAGQKELTALFAAAEKADSNKDKNVADLTNTTVAKNFENISGAARMTTAPYSATDLKRVSDTLREGSADRLGTVTPQMAQQLGLSPGSTELTVSTSVDETRGMGNRTNSVTIYRDAKSGEYFKEYNNDADGKNTPMVPLTAAEKELVRQLDASRLSGSTPNQQAMMNELFSFDGDV